jgi:hypothetical protein
MDASDEPLSNQVNAAVRIDLEERRQRRLLRELLDEMEEEYGPPDEDLVRHFIDLLA